MLKILVTAFEPFGGLKKNPALDVMAKLQPGSFGNCRLFRVKLPVSGKAAEKKIAALISRYEPDLLVSLGLAAGETGLRVERFALNIQDYRIKDNAGYKPEGKKIDAEGPAAYFVSSDPCKLAAAARKAGVPAYVSNHAGAYVCNHLMYAAMRAITAGDLKTRFAFLHLPLTTEMALAQKNGGAASPSLPLALLVKAVTVVINAVEKEGR